MSRDGKGYWEREGGSGTGERRENGSVFDH